MEEIDAIENLVDEIVAYGCHKRAAGKATADDPARAEAHERNALDQINRIRELLGRPF